MWTKQLKFSAVGLCMIALAACSTGEKEQVSQDAGKEAIPPAAEENPLREAVCIWDNISVREAPSGTSKWLTALSLGEEIKAYRLMATDSAKDREYIKIQLKDGTEGWSVASFIVPEAKPAVILSESSLYRRPDMLTKTDEVFAMTDVVAVLSTQDEWAEVRGQRSGDNWLDQGWVNSSRLSYEKVDLAVAKFAKEAMAKSSPQEQADVLKTLIDNKDFSSSALMEPLKAQYASLLN